jgi:hypothetical protein
MRAHSNDSPILETLCKQTLNEVVFVQGYVQLRFDSALLNAYTPPRVVTPNTIVDPSSATYREVLLKQIGKMVSNVRDDPKRKLTIGFESQTRLEISLEDEDRVAADAAMLQIDSGKRWNTW